MDGDSSKKQIKKGVDCNHKFNGCNVFQPIWLRRLIQEGNGLDRFLLDYGYYFLLPFGSMFHIVLFIEKII